jgi:hypothetical protein
MVTQSPTLTTVAVRYVPLASFGDFENIGFELHFGEIRKFVRVFVSGSCSAAYFKNDKETIKKAAYLFMREQLQENDFYKQLLQMTREAGKNSDWDFRLYTRDYEEWIARKNPNIENSQITNFTL